MFRMIHLFYVKYNSSIHNSTESLSDFDVLYGLLWFVG